MMFQAIQAAGCSIIDGSIPHGQETKESLGEAAQDLADLWATRADILMNLGGLKRASNVLCPNLGDSLIFPKFAASNHDYCIHDSDMIHIDLVHC